ncbi:response regulator [Leptolyngbya sp. NK1-12]|uniref:Response regulator n=1 Tax=Leptolyngbya sp. NK1-12 TaxID=2547451 RepID=A0AA97AHT5_9CYAN|nr:response regulator [Leptolyngbya sp. NK1-12]
MSDANTEFDRISRQFMSLERPKKPKMLVVDDEPDNLDLLYRTFRRDFNVLRAESGIVALEILAAEGEVAVIISDQRMPEMKGTEFLSKTVPQYPDTMRIILTGFTDVEDLVEAINSGQVYKYITKPWDPNELKLVVQRAAETYELLKQRTDELRRAQAQMALLSVITQTVQQAASVEDCLIPIADAFAQTFSADTCVLQLVDGKSLVTQATSAPGVDLSQDPLVQATIASGTMQVAVNIPTDPQLSALPYYAEAGIQSHLVVPVQYQNQGLAVLSLQWKQPQILWEDELSLLHLAAQQVGMVITCNRRLAAIA